MAEPFDSRRVRAEAYRDYVGLQLRFAEVLADRGDLNLGEALRRYTSLHRRLGLGNVTAGPPGPEWADFARQLEEAPDAQARLDGIVTTLAAAPDEQPQPNQVRFGCFSYEPPQDGVLRIHFTNRDSEGGAGPLAQSKAEIRQSELSRMFDHVRRLEPEAKTVAGASWLYHVQAYRRLYPPAYTATATPAGEMNLTGNSSWGQFLTHGGAIRPALSAEFLAGLTKLDPQAPWLAFPLRPLRVSAPLAVFTGHFGLG